MQRRNISFALLASATGAALLPRPSQSQTCNQPCYPQTTAEAAANVTPTYTNYVPGDLRRYGAMPNGIVTSALVAAANQASQPGGAPVYISSALGTGCTISQGVTFSLPVKIYGDGYGTSVLTATADITVFSFASNINYNEIYDLQLVGIGSGATRPGVLFTNSSNNQITRCLVHAFGVGVRFAPGSGSSFLNCIRDSQIISNQTTNIDAQKNTNALFLQNVTFGGTPAQKGVSIVDSNGLSIVGFDCEHVSVCCVDIDNPTLQYGGGHVISGGYCENNTCTAGDIRIGASDVNPVIGVRIMGMLFSPKSSDDSAVNIVNAIGVSVSDVFQEVGYWGTGIIDGWLRLGTNVNGLTVNNFGNGSASIEAAIQTYGTVAWSHTPLSGSPTQITNGSVITVNGLTIQRVVPSGSSGVSGLVLERAKRPGQMVKIINTSPYYTLAFAATSVSNVADGTSDVIAPQTSRSFIWDNVTNGGVWYREG